MTIILHVGAGKCGSSSLQTRLSRAPLLASDDGSAAYEYVCIRSDGQLLRREAIEQGARLAPQEAQVSASADHAWAKDRAKLQGLGAQLRDAAAEGRTLIASHECWLTQSGLFRANETLIRLGLRAKIVAFVRPQVPWLNSAWWQWGAWLPRKTPRNWIEGSKHRASWAKLIEDWRSVPGVDEVEVHLATGDVVSTFFGSLGISIASAARRNASLDENLLRYLLQHPDLRSEHRSTVDFILEQRLAEGPSGTPWVLEQDQIAALIDYYRADNMKLLSLLPPKARQAMERDPMWWDAAAYSQRNAVSAAASEPGIEALKDISRRAIDAVIRLDSRVRSLEAAHHDLTTGAARSKRKPLGRMLRKAISLNGISRLVGAGPAAAP